MTRIRAGFAGETFTASLFESPAAHEFLAMLPLDLVIEDYSTNEKIAYLPRKLSESGDQPFSDEAVGDLCYYAPWGNLVFYYGWYRYSPGLVRLGRLDRDTRPLLTRGTYPLRLEIVI